MIKRKLLIIFLSLSLMISGCGMINCMVSTDVTNRFETGIVDISLSLLQKEGNTEIAWRDNQTIVPGDTVSRIPRIHNDGNDCYVRAKITTVAKNSGELSDADLSMFEAGGFSDKWVKADDGYYYCKDILPHGEDVDVFQWVTYSSEASQKEVQGKQLQIHIDVDAIQSKNFTPNFSAASPWGSVEILKCEKEGQYDISTFKQAESNAFQVVYQGNAGKLITNSDDFFSNFPYLMPGDSYSDSAKLENNSSNSIKLYFRSEAMDDSELLDKVQLKITTTINGKSETVYEGSVKAESLKKDVLLGTIPRRSNGDFDFEIAVPEELNNQYSILSSSVRWVFSVQEIDNGGSGSGGSSGGGGTTIIIKPPVDPPVEPPINPPVDPPVNPPEGTGGQNPPGNSQTDNGSSTQGSQGSSSKTENPKTGDSQMLTIYTATFFTSLLLLVVVIAKPKKEKEEMA